MHRLRKPDSVALAKGACDFECLIEPAFAQARCCDRYGGEPIGGSLVGDSAEKEPGERRDDTQVPAEFQPPNQVIDRRRIGERTDRAVNRGMSRHAGAARLRMGDRTRSAGDARLRQSRQLAGTGVAEVRDGPARLVAEQADTDITVHGLHRASSASAGRAIYGPCIRRVVHLGLERCRSSALDAPGLPTHTRWSWWGHHPGSIRYRRRSIESRCGASSRVPATETPSSRGVMLTARDGLFERLDDIRIAPRRILDLGAGTGATAPPPRASFPRSRCGVRRPCRQLAAPRQIACTALVLPASVCHGGGRAAAAVVTLHGPHSVECGDAMVRPGRSCAGGVPCAFCVRVG